MLLPMGYVNKDRQELMTIPMYEFTIALEMYCW